MSKLEKIINSTRDPPPRDNSRVLESVSSLRDANSGSITEIKVWSQTTTSPPVEPLSSQSSTSEDSSKERRKYRLSKTPKKLKNTPSGKHLIDETVSSLRDAASASLSDLKEWAHNHTRSYPIQAVSSSSSTSDESVVESKPHARRKTVHQPQPLCKNSSYGRDALGETVTSFRNAANETMSGIKEWAAKLPKTRESAELQAANETRRLHSKQHGEPAASPQRATRTLYGAETGYETMGQFENSSQKKQLPCSPQFKMMQDLVSPFLVCSSGAAQSVVQDDEPKSFHVHCSDRKKGEAVRESAWTKWNPIIGALDRRADSFEDSILTYDSEAEEQEQIRRMTVRKSCVEFVNAAFCLC